MEQTLVQILVVVANIQVRTLKTEVEKGSIWTSVGYGLVDPKTQGNSVCIMSRRAVSAALRLGTRKGNRSIFLYQAREGWQHNRVERRQSKFQEEFSFLFHSLAGACVRCLPIVRAFPSPDHLGSELLGDKVLQLGEYSTCRNIWCTLNDPWKSQSRQWFSYLFVLITAAGLQG